MRLYRKKEGYKLIYPELSGLLAVAQFPWTITNSGLIKENCEILFLGEDEDMIRVKIKIRKTVGIKHCFILEKEEA